jgi:hypothetical protein
MQLSTLPLTLTLLPSSRARCVLMDGCTFMSCSTRETPVSARRCQHSSSEESQAAAEEAACRGGGVAFFSYWVVLLAELASAGWLTGSNITGVYGIIMILL